MLKSFKKGRWVFNVDSIQKNYSILNSWEKYNPWLGDVLFIAGQYSPYIKRCHYADIYQQFPKSLVHVLQSGHWMHIEQKDSVVSIINDFLLK